MDLVAALIDAFDASLAVFEADLSTGIESHIETMRRRSQFQTAAQALAHDDFLSQLRRTLSDWGLRRSQLLELDEFITVVRQNTQVIQTLEGLTIGTSAAENAWELIWNAILAVPITRRAPRLVSGTKLYHHLFPELVVPVDRTYRGRFCSHMKIMISSLALERKTVSESVFDVFHGLLSLYGQALSNTWRAIAHIRASPS